MVDTVGVTSGESKCGAEGGIISKTPMPPCRKDRHTARTLRRGDIPTVRRLVRHFRQKRRSQSHRDHVEGREVKQTSTSRYAQWGTRVPPGIRFGYLLPTLFQK